MPLLYESDRGQGLTYQLARRDDGFWFSRWIEGDRAKPWRCRFPPGRSAPVTSENPPAEIMAGNVVLRLRANAQIQLPED